MVCKGNKAGGEEAEVREHQHHPYCQSTGRSLSQEAETLGAVPNPASNPPQGPSQILGVDAWWEQDKSPRAVGESRRDWNKEGLYVSTPPYILPFPASCCVQLHWTEDGKGKQEALAVPAGTCREARGKKSQGSKGKGSLTHTVLIPGYPFLTSSPL